ncbi:MAG: hypothetical protein HYV09_28035 [Deltaproteobacteria bacterium]|nr:hypothetical protein [Deltaproteobacteria bacterium]
MTALAVASRVKRWRLPRGARLPTGAAPLGVRATRALEDGPIEAGDAVWVAPPSGVDAPSALAAALPDPSTVRGALIVVGPAAEVGTFARLLGRERRLPRAVRGSALLLAGYAAIGGGVDSQSGHDLCWGEA